MAVNVIDRATKATTRQIRVLNAIYPYLSMLQAYNTENFKVNSAVMLCRPIGYAFRTAVVTIWIPIVLVLGCWHFTGGALDLWQFSAAFPIFVSYVQAMLMLTILSLRNREIGRRLSQLQAVIDESELRANGTGRFRDRNCRE